MKDKIITIYSDGGSRGNPGPSASAFVVMRNGKIFYKESEYLGKSTNNLAEYNAVFMALRWLSKNAPKISQSRVDYFLDSQLAVNQLNGIYKVKNRNIKEYFNKIKSIEVSLPFKVFYKHVRREENKISDALVNEKLDELKEVSR